MIKKVLILIFGNIKLLFIKLFHFTSFNYSVYNNVSILSEIDINNKGKIKIGKKFILRNNSLIASHGNGNIEIGNYCGINKNCYIVSHDKIKIGDNVIIGPNVVIVDHDHKITKNGINKKEYKTKEIIIEDGAWIGANCVILKGSKIGKNCIVGAGATVNFEIPDNTILVQKNNNEFIENNK